MRTIRIYKMLTGMLAKLRRGLKSSYLRSVAMLFSGQFVAAAIPLITAPILGRLYDPAHYGFLGLFMAASVTLGSVGNWQYSQGIIVEGRTRNACSLLHACQFTSVLTALVSIPIAIYLVFFSGLLASEARLFFLLLPPSVFLTGSLSALCAMATRNKRFRLLAINQVACVSLSAITAISMGSKGLQEFGLLTALIVGQLVNYTIIFCAHHRKDRVRCPVSFKRIKAMLRKHKDYAICTMPAVFVNSLNQQLPVWFLGFAGATGTLGLFNRARQLMSMPVNLLSGSVAQVFQQRAAVDYKQNGNCISIFRKTGLAILAAGLLPTILLAIWAPDLLVWFLGEKWRDAGAIARILAPMLLLRMVCSPLSTVFYIAGKQKEDVILKVLAGVIVAVCVATGHFVFKSPYWMVAGFSVAFGATYILYLVRGYQHALGHAP